MQRVPEGVEDALRLDRRCARPVACSGTEWSWLRSTQTAVRHTPPHAATPTATATDKLSSSLVLAALLINLTSTTFRFDVARRSSPQRLIWHQPVVFFSAPILILTSFRPFIIPRQCPLLHFLEDRGRTLASACLPT